MSLRILVVLGGGEQTNGALAELTQELCFEVETCGGTREEVLQAASEAALDVVLLEWESLGSAAASLCRTLAARRPIPIVAVVDSPSQDELKKLVGLGVHGVVSKPVTPAQLQATVPVACWQCRVRRDLERKVVELDNKLQERKYVDRAKGVLQERLGMTEEQAYDRLRRGARKNRKTLAEVARGVIDAHRFMAALEEPSSLS